VGTSTTAAPSKRRKMARADSDMDTDVEDDSEENKENESPAEQQAMQVVEREVVREERYQVLQSELRESGSSRVLNKRVTSALWEARQPLRTLFNNVAMST